MQAIEAGDAGRTSKTVMDAMPALYRPLGDKVAALSRMQMEIARASYEAGQREHDGLSALTAVLLLGGIVGGGC